MTSGTKFQGGDIFYIKDFPKPPPKSWGCALPESETSGEDIGASLGAKESASQKVAITIATQDQHGNEIPGIKKYVDELNALFASIAGGSCENDERGTWQNPKTNHVVRENIIRVHASMNAGSLKQATPRLREFCHRFGRETNQGAVGIEVNNVFYSISDYDQPPKAS